jgi:hypothetical protein
VVLREVKRMSDAVSQERPRGAPSKKDLPEAFGGRRGAESELLLISEAVAQLKDGMHGNFGRPEAVTEAKEHYPGASIGLGPRKEDVAERIYKAILQEKLSVFVRPDSTEGEEHRPPLQVPLGVVKRMSSAWSL